jgi:hypothetical protein
MSSPARAPFPSRTAFVPTVVPCAKKLTSPSVVPTAAANSPSASWIAAVGFFGVDGSFVT